MRLSRVQEPNRYAGFPFRDGCVGRRVHDKSNGAERGGVHGNDVTRVPARVILPNTGLVAMNAAVSPSTVAPAVSSPPREAPGTRCRQR